MSRFSEVGSVPPGGRKLLKFLILFENPNLLFFPGQFLSGRVLVELEDETPVTEATCVPGRVLATRERSVRNKVTHYHQALRSQHANGHRELRVGLGLLV